MTLDKINVVELHNMCLNNANQKLYIKKIIERLLCIGGMENRIVLTDGDFTEKLINKDVFVEKGKISEILKKVLEACKARLYLENSIIHIIRAK